MRAGFDGRMNMKWDPDANGVGQGGYVPLQIHGFVPRDQANNTTHNADPNMGRLNNFDALQDNRGVWNPVTQQFDPHATNAPTPSLTTNGQPSTPQEASWLPQRGFAYGGTAHTAVVGDPQRDGLPNPEIVTSASPIHVMPMKNDGRGVPHYAYGSDSDRLTGDPPQGTADEGLNYLRGGPGSSYQQPSQQEDSHWDWLKSPGSGSSSSPPPAPIPENRPNAQQVMDKAKSGMMFADHGQVGGVYSMDDPNYAKAVNDRAAAKSSGASDLAPNEINGDSDSHIGAMTDSGGGPPPPAPVSTDNTLGFDVNSFGAPNGSGAPQVYAAPTQTYQAPPTSFDGAEGSAVSAADQFRQAATQATMDERHGVVANRPANLPPPAPQMDANIPRPGEDGFTPSATLNRWNQGVNPIREQIAVQRYNRNHPLAGLQRDTAIDAHIAQMNREADKFNIGQQQKEIETLRKTAHNIAQEQHLDDTIKGKNAIETAKLQETARKEQNKRVEEAQKASEAYGALDTRYGMLNEKDKDFAMKKGLLDDMVKNIKSGKVQNAKTIEAFTKFYDEMFPREVEIGGQKGIAHIPGSFTPTYPSHEKAPSAKAGKEADKANNYYTK